LNERSNRRKRICRKSPRNRRRDDGLAAGQWLDRSGNTNSRP
jgi:hypothetical protein